MVLSCTLSVEAFALVSPKSISILHGRDNCAHSVRAQMGTIRRMREIYHVHSLPASLRDQETHNPQSHTHVVHRVREKKRTDTRHNPEHDDLLRYRFRRQIFEPPNVDVTYPDLPPVSISRPNGSCPEDGVIAPPMSPHNTLESTMHVDMADTIILREYQQRTSSREFGNNYVHAAIFVDHTMVEKYDGDERFLIRYHLAMFNIVSPSFLPISHAYYLVISRNDLSPLLVKTY